MKRVYSSRHSLNLLDIGGKYGYPAIGKLVFVYRDMYLSCCSQCPPWLQPNMPSYEGLVGAYYATVCNAHKSLQSVLSVFCSNLNCIQAYCWTHGTSPSTLLIHNS